MKWAGENDDDDELTRTDYKMKAVVLAAGKGSRLGRHTDYAAKGMLRVGGAPILWHCLAAVARLAPEEIVLVRGHGGAEIEAYFGGSFHGVPIGYVNQPTPTGSAHALLTAEPRLGDEFVVANGDNVFGADLRPVLARRRKRDRAAVLLTERVPPERAKQGVCRTEPDGRLVSIVEFPGPEEREVGRVVAGFYAFTRPILETCRDVRPGAAGEHELSDAINLLLSAGHTVDTIPLDGWRVNINDSDDLLRAEDLLRQEVSLSPRQV